MIENIKYWFNEITTTHARKSILIAAFLLIVLSEIQYPIFEWEVLFRNIMDWADTNYSLLFNLFTYGIIVAGLYLFFIHKNLVLFSKKFNRHRFLLVLFVGVAEGILVYSFWCEFKVFINQFGEKPNWLGTMITTAIAAPIALVIWWFRNTDKNKGIQQTEESIRQTDFHKIEEWAAAFSSDIAQGVESSFTKNKEEQKSAVEEHTNTNNGILIKSKVDEKRANVLQVAAIYQLLPYLKGEYGDRFIRPTMEIYRSLLSSWLWSEKEEKLAENGESLQIEKPSYINALHSIIRQEFVFFRKFHEHPICKKSNWVPLDGIDLKAANLTCIDFGEANLQNADLRGAYFNYADLSGALLDDANLKGANLKHAIYSDIKSTYLNEQTILSDGSKYIAPIDK